jgi:3',5'-cyclic-AMP phosphodiesterase
MLRVLRRLSSLNPVIKKQLNWIAAVSTLVGAAAFLFAQASASVPANAPLRFAILGDRTGETVPGVYAAVWREIAAAKPAFVVGVGDSIQGLDDDTAEKEWTEFDQVLEPFHSIPYYAAPGNHDVWSDASAKLFVKHSGHPLDYSFDKGPVHVTILDNSRNDDLQPGEMTFLEQDLKAHEAQPVKFIVSHRPSWLLNVVLANPNFPLHQLAQRYGVHYVVAGHVHEMMHAKLGGVEYISAPSAGGHLRASGKYEDGWFFGYILATVNGTDVQFEVHELPAPNGEGRVTLAAAWGMLGLVRN